MATKDKLPTYSDIWSGKRIKVGEVKRAKYTATKRKSAKRAKRK